MRALLLGLCASAALPLPATAQETRLLREPTMSRDRVVFAWAGDLWAVPRSGGTADRLTATPGVEADPRFSPDGTLVAFTATVAGNTDVYVVPADGGDPRRLTYHPGVDRAQGWTPDGRRVLLASGRVSAPLPYARLWTVDREGGMPEPLPMPRAVTGAFSPDGRSVAYEEIPTAFLTGPQNKTSQWRHYRGGRTHPVRVMDLGDHSVRALPWTDSNDTDPMWVGDRIYFLSDRDHTVNLFAWSASTGEVEQLTRHDDFDVMSASAGPDAVVYEQAGYVHLFDPGTGESRRLDVQVRGDLPWARARFEDVASSIRDMALSPTGVRAAFEARGEIFTFPAGDGDHRNLTRSPGVHDRSPVWSPDGSRIAWLSDASGEYRLMLGDPLGLAEPRALELPGTSFFSRPRWSPDGRHVTLADNHLNLWLIELESGAATRIDTDTYADPGRAFDPVWAPDSRWIAYSKSLDNHLRAIYAYSLDSGRAVRLTDGLSDAITPAFDAGGRYLYFLASTDYGPQSGWLEMSSLDHPTTRAVYLAVLRAEDPSPLLPEAGEEPGVLPDAPAAGDTSSAVRIDAEGIDQRILALDVPAGDYGQLTAGPAGTVFYTQAGEGPGVRLRRYRLSERSADTFLEGIGAFTLSGDGSKLLYRAGGGPSARWGVVSTDRPSSVGEGALSVRLQMRIDPRAEWAQIFRETWRIQREFFYDAEMHGADWEAVYDRYAPLAEHVGHRADLGYLIATVGGELGVGHSYLTGGGDQPGEDPVTVGLLGADFAVEDGRYRIRRIYDGENWNPDLRAPLSQPGVLVSEGDYVLEVNGRPLAPPTNPYSAFEGLAGRQVALRVGPSASGEGSRLVTVVPVASETGLRTRAWIEDNRRTVDRLSGGRLAYVWLPNTAGAGYGAFNRYFYAQQDKEGAVIDERYNQGGMVADYVVNELDRKPMGFFAQRDGKEVPSPIAGLYGPKVMLINESAGSGGDALPYYVRLRGLGPLIGTRTWGGLVGTLGTPPTIDGGGITAPTLAFYDLDGRWAVENEGVAPDIEVEYSAAEVIAGRDPQLERAVEEALNLLETHPPVRVARPAPIDRVSRPGGGGDGGDGGDDGGGDGAPALPEARR
ncbi:MAG TPA: PDZ domain-containing protein [Longimicrobiales bacterium]|nr:PDZ domain-containing protein [Longimicrobiales bacterium]